jgi:hypothetical protein
VLTLHFLKTLTRGTADFALPAFFISRHVVTGMVILVRHGGSPHLTYFSIRAVVDTEELLYQDADSLHAGSHGCFQHSG